MTNVSNSKTMTLEDLLVQRLKSDTLYQLIDNEDALRELTAKALEKALFASGHAYNSRTGEVDNLRGAVLQAADVSAKKLVCDVMQTLADDDAFKELVRQAVLTSMPQAIKEYSHGLVNHVLAYASTDAMNKILTYQK